MLTELSIQNFALIEEIHMNLRPGFNVLTGETGAGKSIILDAMALVLGERADTTLIREGSERANVEVVFKVDTQAQTELWQIVESEGLEGDDEDLLVLSRELRLNGRNICRVNGRTVNLAILRDIGDVLVDIHGQGAHLSLMKPRSHLPLLDAFAGIETDKQNFRSQVLELRSIRNELANLRQDDLAVAKRQELLAYQVEEIEAANLSPGEEEELLAERKRLASVEQLMQHGSEALALLDGLNIDSPGASDLLSLAQQSLKRLSDLDDSLQPMLEAFQDLYYQFGDLTADLVHYVESLEHNPIRLNRVEARLELIKNLERKYGGSIEAVLAWEARAREELDTIHNSEKRVRELEEQELQQLELLGNLGAALSDKRQKGAIQLAEEVERELALLNLEQAIFEVSFSRSADEKGVIVGDKRLAFTESGIDQVEFLVTTNPGESVRPLAKVASGGETSRLMLALKSVLARVDETPTLIFDEIDQGIGGRVGDVVGRKLWRLTNSGRHQVLVVTHLPQLAGYADNHYNVSKSAEGGRTITKVQHLDEQSRIEELAAMLGTMDDHATGGAQSILERVAAVKNGG